MNKPKEFDHLFRHEYGKVVSALANKYSFKIIDLIEDSVQEALLKAMILWGYKDIPENPSGWLFRVANNHLIDQFRKNKQYLHAEKMLSRALEIGESQLTNHSKQQQALLAKVYNNLGALNYDQKAYAAAEAAYLKALDIQKKLAQSGRPRSRGAGLWNESIPAYSKTVTAS